MSAIPTNYTIRLIEEKKDFHATHSNLSQWLGAKDRMMTALGSISSDSNLKPISLDPRLVDLADGQGEPVLEDEAQSGEAVLADAHRPSKWGRWEEWGAGL